MNHWQLLQQVRKLILLFHFICSFIFIGENNNEAAPGNNV
jgi:hypothetical protein